MRVGLMFPPHDDPAEVAPVARCAERQGFDFFACGEHIFFHGPVSNAFVTLAAAAGATQRIRLLSALSVLPLYPAALAVKMAVTLDRVSDGRFDLGVGVGGEYPAEFAAAGVPLGERGRRADEALALLDTLCSGERVEFSGQFSTVDGELLAPLPVQRPRPPIWVGGRRQPAMRRAGRFGDVWLPYLVTPEKLATSLARVREFAVAAGRSPDAVRGAVFCWSAVADDAQWARRTALDTVSRTYRQDFTDLAKDYLVAGDVAEVTDRLVEYAEAGADSVVFAPACPRRMRDRVIETFATEVMPALRTSSDRERTHA